MKNKKTTSILFLFIFLLAACSGTLAETLDNSQDSLFEVSTEASDISEEIQEENGSQITDAVILPEYDEEDLGDSYDELETTTIQLNGSSVTYEGNGVVVDDSLVTITSGGAYLISGVLDDGQIIVDTQDEEIVRLILDGVNITTATSAPIYVRNAKKTIITLADSSDNWVTDGTTYILEDGDEPSAAIFSNDDLTINGSGSLTVFANNNDGIDSDDDLIISGATITVTAVNDGIKGRDSLTVKDGYIIIDAGGDGMQANNDVDEGEGNIIIEGGNFDISADNDGIQAENALLISDGTFRIVTGSGSAEADLDDLVNGQRFDQRNNDSNALLISAKGLKAGVDLRILGGIFELDTLDDSIHSNGVIQINGGSFLISSGDDGLHADSQLEINDGILDISLCYEGIESAVITINDGTIHVTALDDGLNAASNSDVEELEPGTNRPMNTGENQLEINGGYIFVDSGGDGVDVNGDLTVNDGILLVNGGPSTVPDGAFDFVNFNINGGFILGVGSAAMAEAASQTSTQNSVLYNFESSLQANEIVHLESPSGDEILTYASNKEIQSILFSSPEIMDEETYLIYTGGSASGEIMDGLYSNGNYEPGNQVDSFVVTDIITTAGVAVSEFMAGRGGFPSGQRQDGMNAPQMGNLEMDDATQLILGILSLDDTDMAVSPEQAETLLPLWESFLDNLSENQAFSGESVEILEQIKLVLTDEQQEIISSLSVNDLMSLMAQMGDNMPLPGDRMRPDRGALENQGLALVQFLLDYLNEKIAL